jgi:hypothetical protein
MALSEGGVFKIAWLGHWNTSINVNVQAMSLLFSSLTSKKLSIEHSTILLILLHMGFDEMFIKWIKLILESSSSSILVNGVPGAEFKCRRGVRHGDPLSPLLFVSGAELLQVIINQAFE